VAVRIVSGVEVRAEDHSVPVTFGWLSWSQSVMAWYASIFTARLSPAAFGVCQDTTVTT